MYFKIHIITICLSYIIFFISSLAAMLFLIQDSAIKNKRTGIILSRLPDLVLLDKLNYRSISLAFPLLTLAIFSGVLWTESVHGTYWWGYSFRQLASLVLWLVYAVILHVRLSAKMRGRKVALLSILAFFIIIISLFGTCR